MMLLRGANVKAKANAAQGIPELIEIATKKAHKDNFKEKHNTKCIKSGCDNVANDESS